MSSRLILLFPDGVTADKAESIFTRTHVVSDGFLSSNQYKNIFLAAAHNRDTAKKIGKFNH